MIDNDKPLIVIAGPTASGKTSLAIELAKKFGGEIICADSRTIYKGLDIGTAKPSKSEQAEIPHWGLDLVEPGEYFSVSDFKKYALDKIKEIISRGKIPFLVGGTGLYIDAVVFDFQFGEPADETKRKILNDMTIEQLHEYCKKYNITLPENKFNKRYVIRTIERNGNALLRREKPIDNAIIVGITTSRDVLRNRIALRIEQIFNDNVVIEAKGLGDKYGWDSEAMKGNIYPLINQYLAGGLSFDDMKNRASILDWQLAKRQMTWLKRNLYIKWGSIVELKAYLSDLLAKS
jgi:tRNA dimethylallyltransferase